MEAKKNTYEGMFLLDSGLSDFQTASEPVTNILSRYGAEIMACKPWDDRKLAYPIRGRKRGLYVLAYFRLDTSRVVEVEHDCRLDERILRVIILRRDAITEQEIAADTPAMVAARRPADTPSAEAQPSAPAEVDAAVEMAPSIDADLDAPADS